MSVRELPDQIDEDNAADGKGFAVIPALQGLEDFFDKFHGFLLLINCGRWTAIDLEAMLVAEHCLASLMLLLRLQLPVSCALDDRNRSRNDVLRQLHKVSKNDKIP